MSDSYDWDKADKEILKRFAETPDVEIPGMPPPHYGLSAKEAIRMLAKKDMRQTDNLDDSEYICPCGSHFTNDSRTTYPELRAWLQEHTPHSSGYVSGIISDDGMRCLSKDTERSYRRKL